MTSDPDIELDDLTRAQGNAAYMRTAITRLTQGVDVTDPETAPEWLALMRRLYLAGRHDLALGRLFEGHVDALQIIARYGELQTAARLHAIARHGAVFGVWNAPLPGEPLSIADGLLSGGKSFASGAGIISHALVTLNAGEPGRVQLLVVDLAATPPVVDTHWWHTLGMQHSETHRVRWHEQTLDDSAFVGQAGDYERLPWFATGALRFVAVQAGGIAALFDKVRAHLVAADRAGDIHQTVRLARLFSLAESAAAVCRHTAARLHDAASEEQATRVANARTAVADLAEEAISLAQQSVGLQGLFKSHPLATVLADLMVYLRQPGPDAQRMCVGEAAAAGKLVPGL